MVTYLSKFFPDISDITDSMRQLLKKYATFAWSENQTRYFYKLEDLLIKKPVLKYFEVNKPVVLSVDSSSVGLGAVLLQDNLPVAYASKALTTNQRMWAQIEKDLLALVHGCERFHQ